MSRRFLAFLFLLTSPVLAQLPTVTGLSPLKGPPGTHVLIGGKNFTGAGDPEFKVEFNGARATVLGANSTLIEVLVPAAATTGPVTVYTTFGQDSSAVDFQPSPRVTDAYTQVDQFSNPIKPVVAVPGQEITVLGFNFNDPAGQLAIFIGGARATGEASADTQIHAVVPAAAQTGPVIVTNSAGAATNGIVYLNPVITTFTPSAAIGDTIDLFGRSFLGATDMTVGGAPAQFTVKSGTNLQAVVPAAAVDGKLTVTSPGGTYITAGTFKLLPKVVGFSPVGGAVGTVVTLDGTSLNGTTAVRFGDIAAAKFTNISSVKVTAVVPNGAFTAPIKVVTANGTNVSAASFYVAPVISNVSPGSGQVGTEVVITGANFTGATQVALGDVDAADFVLTATNKLTAHVPVGAVTANWKVTTPGGTATSADSFLVFGPAPVISSFAPNAGPAGTAVTITGLNLASATKVEFNGQNAAFTVNGANLVATVPAAATTGPIRVTNPAGQTTSVASFTVGGSADLRVTFSASAPAIAYGPLSFNVQVLNRGPLTAVWAKVVVTLPTGATFDSVSGATDFDVVGSKVTFNLGDLANNASLSAFVRVRLGGPAALTAKAEATSDTADSVPANNAVSVNLSVALPALTLELADEANLSLQWSSLATNYVLESTASLKPATVWGAVADVPDDDGVNRQLILPFGGGDGFYRLRLKQ